MMNKEPECVRHACSCAVRPGNSGSCGTRDDPEASADVHFATVGAAAYVVTGVRGGAVGMATASVRVPALAVGGGADGDPAMHVTAASLTLAAGAKHPADPLAHKSMHWRTTMCDIAQTEASIFGTFSSKVQQLVAMKPQDFYDVLGVEHSASAHDIKRAYRRLAHAFHPDVSDDPDGECKFKEIGEAYES